MGKFDCVGELCPEEGCEEGFFACDMGNCIDINYLCDGFCDCIDHTDEDNCSKYIQFGFSVIANQISKFNSIRKIKWNNSTELKCIYKTGGVLIIYCIVCILYKLSGNLSVFSYGIYLWP